MKCPKCHSDNPDTSSFCADCGTQLVSIKDVSVTKTLQMPLISPGKTIAGKYKILSELGRGGMGVVYKAKDTRLKRTVALKFLPAELTKDKAAKKRFIQEAQAAAALEHPNICTVYEVDEADSQTFIAMSYIDGKSLKDMLREGPLTIDEAKDIALQVSEGLKEAHEKGIVHRDIKPANIMLTMKGQAKITDFGLAKLSWGVDLTKTSTIMGTVAYMSPEQARGEKIDHRIDIWSLGAMMYEMLTGERPFKKAHEQALIYSILNDEPEPIASIRSDIPSHITNVIRKALEKVASNRYQDMKELIQDLKRLPMITTPKAEKSIAVLPFVDMSSEKDQEYFCEGIAEELISALARIEKLHVVSRTSSFQFKGKVYDIKDIGRKLRVQTILEGSLRKSGDRLRITAQLINVEDGYHLWSERYDRKLDDVFAIQDEISMAIIDNLKIRLLGKEKSAIVKHHTDHAEAYNLYLQGRYFWSSRYEGGMKKGLRYFQRAIEKDPLYALPYVGIADSYSIPGFWGMMSPNDSFPKAKSAAIKALEIDDSLGEAHSSLALISLFFDWDWSAAESGFKRAIELSPEYASAHSWYSLYLSAMRHFDQAIVEARHSQQLDPLSPIINGVIGRILIWTSRYDEAIEQLNNTLEMYPDFQIGLLWLGEAYMWKGKYEDAFSVFPKEFTASGAGGITYALGTIGWAYAHSGQKEEALRMLDQLNAISKEGYVSPVQKAFILIGLGDKDKSIEQLEMAYSEHDSFLTFLNIWNFFEPLRSDSRFKALLKKMNLE